MYFFNSWHFVDLFFYMEEEMKYVYDILLNFNEKLYEFYDTYIVDYIFSVFLFSKENKNKTNGLFDSML